jgi:transcriptional regulator GlxA family with amidase domain
MKTIGILVFEQVEELDFIGPLEVFGMAPQFGADCQTVLIAPQLGPLRCRHGLRVLPEYTLEEAPALDVLIVPGSLGARTQARADPKILEFYASRPAWSLRSALARSSFAAAGVLDGLSATTHPFSTRSSARTRSAQRSQRGSFCDTRC